MDTATTDRNNAGNKEVKHKAPASSVAHARAVPKAPPVSVSDMASPVSPDGAWPGAFAALGAAFQQIKKNPQPALIILGVYAVLAIFEAMAAGGHEVTKTSVSIYSQVRQSYTGLGELIFLLATPIYALAIADRKVITPAEFFAVNVRKYFSVFLATILFALIIIASIPTLMIAAIWFVPWFAFITYLIVDKDAGPIKAFGLSKALGRHNKSKVWGIVGAAILMYIPVAVITSLLVAINRKFGTVIGSVLQTSVSLLAYGALAMLYRWAQHNVGDTDA